MKMELNSNFEVWNQNGMWEIKVELRNGFDLKVGIENRS
jgi:hypothetical protein